MKFALGVSLALALVSGSAVAQQKLVALQSEIAFTSKQMGVPVDGKFKRFDAQIAFDPKNPAASKIGFTIDLASASIGSAETEAELGKPDWFAVKAFPQAQFQSTIVKSSGTAKFDVAGKLTIKGNSQEVVVPVTVGQSAGTTTATGSFTIKRLDFKIGEGDWKDTSMVANDVLVKFKLAVTGVPPM